MFNDRGEPVGAQITNYLLEKGRVVGQIDNERDFHVFYQFTKGASDDQRGALSHSHAVIRSDLPQRCSGFKGRNHMPIPA